MDEEQKGKKIRLNVINDRQFYRRDRGSIYLLIPNKYSDNQVNAFAQDVQLGVCNQDCDFDQYIFIKVQTCHLAIDPNQVRGIIF